MAGRFHGFLEHLLGSRHTHAVADPASDVDLLRQFAATNDQNAFELLVWRHGQMVLGVCQRLVRDRDLAEDAFQAVFLVLARKARTIRSSNVAGWLFRVARRVAARALRSRIRHSELPEIGIEQKAGYLERNELASVLDTEIARLPHRLRQPILLCYLSGRSTEEAAQELGCPRGTILSRLSSARKLLAGRLGRKGIALPSALFVIGIEFDGRTVSATVTAALRFLGTNPGVDTASLLAQGVIRTMKLTRSFTILSAAVLAASLIAGVGWVSARSGSGEQARRSVDEVQPNGAPQLAKKEGVLPIMNGGPVRLDQRDLDPDVPEDMAEILKLDPVIARSLKPDAKDSPLRKLQKEASLEWGAYLAKAETVIQLTRWHPEQFPGFSQVAIAFPKSLLELMEKPEDKLKCYELEVRLFEKLYKLTDTRVIGSSPSQNRVAKALWLEARIKLLKFKQEMEKKKG